MIVYNYVSENIVFVRSKRCTESSVAINSLSSSCARLHTETPRSIDPPPPDHNLTLEDKVCV